MLPPFLEDIVLATDGRVFFLTRNGSMGLGPASIKSGDTIHIFPGGRTHFALRKKNFEGCAISETTIISRSIQEMDSRQYVLIGDCYLHSDGISSSQVFDAEAAIDGSLPFEFLGSISLDGALLKVDTIVLV